MRNLSYRTDGTLPVLLFAFAMLACLGRAGAAGSVQNEHLRVSWQEQDGTFSVLHRDTGREFVVGGVAGSEKGEVEVGRAEASLGRRRALTVSHPDGSRDRLMLFPDLPFVVFTSDLHNGGDESATVEKVRRISCPLSPGVPPDRLRAYGTAGLTRPDEHSGSYTYLAVVEPESRAGVVSGWLTHRRGSGVVFSDVRDGRVVLEGQIDYGNLRLGPGETERTELFALGYFRDARVGLERFADAVAEVHEIELPPQPEGYCTWYADRHGGSCDQEHLAELADFAADHLKPYGFEVVQIDDGWQDGVKTNGPRKVIVRHRPDGPYPDGMKPTARGLKAKGLTPGIWFMPFAGNHRDPFFSDRRDWFVKNEDGDPYETSWGGTSLDLSRPEVRKYVRRMVRRISREWGYEYFKMDGLYTGAAIEQIYVNNAYRPDGIGEAVFHDPDRTNLQIYREGLELVRRAAGEEVFLLGCNISQNMRTLGGSFGLVDAMRIGPDTPGSFGGVRYGSRHYFLHRRVWYNDPDCVKLSIPVEQARLFASWAAVSGQLYVVSDWLPGLDEERLEILKRTIPSHGLTARPVDLFRRELPRAWLVTDDRGGRPRHVLGLFNWSSGPAEFTYSLDEIGLDPERTYVAFDFWRDRLLDPLKGELSLKAPGHYCGVLAVRPALDRPQLLSTSRHVMQGVVDVRNERWDAERKALSGTSTVPADDPYELRIVTGGPEWRARAVRLAAADREAGVRADVAQSGRLVRVTVRSPGTRRVRWTVDFAR